LMQFVPVERQSEKIPCRNVPLDAAGQTLNTLYAYGAGKQKEIEEALDTWLKTRIHRLEQVRSNANFPSIARLGNDGEAFLFNQWF